MGENTPKHNEKAAKVHRKPERERQTAPTFTADHHTAHDSGANQLPSGSLLQRQCGCGKHTIAGGVCEECQKKQDQGVEALTEQASQNISPDIQTFRENTGRFNLSTIPTTTLTTAEGRPIQPTLTVNAPNDKYEQEADSVADAVMRMPERPQTPAPPAPPNQPTADSTPLNGTTISRLPQISRIQASGGGNGAFTAPAATESRINKMRGSGQALPAEEQSFFEERMGYDFSGVRVHTDDNAVQASREIQAKAFTVGNNIAFDAGAYRPGTGDGRRLLAHELTHVVQQRGSHSIQKSEEDLHQSLPDSLPAPNINNHPNLLIQRTTVAEAVESDDADQVMAVTDFTTASNAQRVDLIRILLDQMWVNESEETKIIDILASAGNNLQALMNAIKTAGLKQSLFDAIDAQANKDRFTNLLQNLRDEELHLDLIVFNRGFFENLWEGVSGAWDHIVENVTIGTIVMGLLHPLIHPINSIVSIYERFAEFFENPSVDGFLAAAKELTGLVAIWCLTIGGVLSAIAAAAAAGWITIPASIPIGAIAAFFLSAAVYVGAAFLILTGISFVKNLVDAGTATTHEELEQEKEQIAQDGLVLVLAGALWLIVRGVMRIVAKMRRATTEPFEADPARLEKTAERVGETEKQAQEQMQEMERMDRAAENQQVEDPSAVDTQTQQNRSELLDTLETRVEQIEAARGDMNVFRGRFRQLAASGDTAQPIADVATKLNELLTPFRRSRTVTGGGRNGSGVSTYIESLDGKFSIRITHNQVGPNPVGQPAMPRIHIYEGAVRGHGRHVVLSNGTTLTDILTALGL